MSEEDRGAAVVDDPEVAFAELTALLLAADDEHAEAMRMADEAEETFTAVANVLAALGEVEVGDEVWGAFGYGTGYNRSVKGIVADRFREVSEDETSPWIYSYALLVVSYKADGTPSKRPPSRWTAWTNSEGGDRVPRLGVALRPAGPELVETTRT